MGIESRDWYRADPPRGPERSSSPGGASRDTLPPWWAWILGGLMMGGAGAWIADRYFDYRGDPLHDFAEWIVGLLPL